MKTSAKSYKPSGFLSDRHISIPYLEIPILRHGQIILTELNIQYQPMGNRPLLKNNAFIFCGGF